MRVISSDKFLIHGGNKLNGKIEIQTSKNAVLPIMSASIMSSSPVRIIDVPDILDVDNMLKILTRLGAKIHIDGRDIIIDPRRIKDVELDCNLTKTMRSSVFLLGAMLAKFKHACIALPGGCNIGDRPIDIHISALKRLGVEVEEVGEELKFTLKCFRPRKIKLKIPSVGATENIIQFACLNSGKTVILNPAREPEIVDLCNFLSKMGAKILGAGTKRITIYGVDSLTGVQYKPISDRIVAGTIMCAVAGCGGDVKLKNTIPLHNSILIKKLIKMGCQIDTKNDIIHIRSNGTLISPDEISTGYYPDFPTDLQSIMLAITSCAKGETKIKENIFNSRFKTAEELKKIGAEIKMYSTHLVKVSGADRLSGGKVSAYDLRGGAGLVLAGLIASGDTEVENVHFIDRGYEHLEKQLNSLGANIERISK